MDEETLDLLGEVVEHNPDVDLPRARTELELLGTFLDRNPKFDADAPDEKFEQLRALHGTDTEVYVPERRADLDRLVDLLQRHDDVGLLAALLEADDPAALLAAMGYGTGPGDEVSETEAALLDDGDGDDDGGGWFSDDDDEEMFTPEDLESPGEKLGFGAGGVICLLAVLAAWVQGITVYKDVDSWVLSVEVANSGTVMGVAAVAALALGLVVGFVYRAKVDDIHDAYRLDLAGTVFMGPMIASVVGLALYMLAPVVMNLVTFNFVDAVLYLVAVVVVAVIFGTVFLAALGVAVGAVVGLPAYVGVFVGSLFGALAN
jgi:hypothetical protein